jgi:hypothetical protein
MRDSSNWRTEGRLPARERPFWDKESGELWWRGRVVRRLRSDAANQRRVLEAFEAEEWPERIDAPLPREEGLDAKERLRETVKALNAGAEPGGIRFTCDRRRGVRWQRVA